MTLDDHLGFTKNPFSKRSSEQELDFLEDIFFEPNYFKTLTNDLSSGDSRFIIGQRGHGKSSIINKLVEDLEKEESLFVIKIDRFDTIPTKRNETAFLKLILKTLVTKQAIYLEKNRDLVKKLSQSEKQKLAFFIRLFFRTLSHEEYKCIYDNIHKISTRNFFIKLFNKWGLVPVNTAASTAISITANIIRQSIGGLETPETSVYKEYFGKIDEINFATLDIDKEECSKDSLKQMLDQLLVIFVTLGFKNVVILFDKIDEYQELNQDVSKIATFTSEILSDTELLMNEKLAIGFSLWSELRAELSGTVRFDKFGFIDVRWRPIDLEPLIDKRINYFSKNSDKSFSDLVPLEQDRKDLINLANNSPRDLITVLSDIYREQANNNPQVTSFEGRSITNGSISFCSNYDYDSIFPSKTGKNKEIRAMINKILGMRLTRFTIRQLTDTFNQNSSQSEGQIRLMTNYKLIREEDILGPNNTKYYEVIDPKVVFLVKKIITRIE